MNVPADLLMMVFDRVRDVLFPARAVAFSMCCHTVRSITAARLWLLRAEVWEVDELVLHGRGRRENWWGGRERQGRGSMAGVWDVHFSLPILRREWTVIDEEMQRPHEDDSLATLGALAGSLPDVVRLSVELCEVHLAQGPPELARRLELSRAAFDGFAVCLPRTNAAFRRLRQFSMTGVAVSWMGARDFSAALLLGALPELCSLEMREARLTSRARLFLGFALRSRVQQRHLLLDGDSCVGVGAITALVGVPVEMLRSNAQLRVDHRDHGLPAFGPEPPDGASEVERRWWPRCREWWLRLGKRGSGSGEVVTHCSRGLPNLIWLSFGAAWVGAAGLRTIRAAMLADRLPHLHAIYVGSLSGAEATMGALTQEQIERGLTDVHHSLVAVWRRRGWKKCYVDVGVFLCDGKTEPCLQYPDIVGSSWNRN